MDQPGSGEVPTFLGKSAATEDAMSILGVTEVDNLMVVNYPPTFTLPTDADDIEVSVSNGGVELPGLDPDDVEIKTSKDMLTIRGEKKERRKG